MKLETKNVTEWLFENKNGYALENVIATTFTLNPVLLTELAGSMIGYEKKARRCLNEKMFRRLIANNISVLDRLTVFSDDYILPTPGLPKRYSRLLNGFFIPNCVCEISAKRGTFFHPKLLIAHFKNAEESRIRLAVLSKNLALGDSMTEICALFETAPQSEKTVAGAEVADFIGTFLKSTKEAKTGRSLSRDAAAKRIEKTLKALEKTHMRFIVPNGEPEPDEVGLYFVTPDKSAREMLFNDAQNAANGFYCCSDSISPTFWKDLCLCNRSPNKKYLVSNLRSWARFFGEDEKIPDGCFYFAETDGSNEKYPKTVHAKFAEFFGNEHIVWLGSANFTENGFGKNYEAGVRLVYKQAGSLKMPAFSVGENSGFFRVTQDKLKPHREEDELKKLIQSIEWKLQDQKIIGTGLNKPIEKILQCQICTGYTIPLFRNENGYESEPVNQNMIPWYGRAMFVGFESANRGSKPIMIPISVSVEGAGEQPQLTSEGSAKALVRGGFDLIDLIPPEPNGGYELYGMEDSFDIRLAKFMAKGGQIKDITENITRTKHANEADTELDEDDIEDTDDITLTAEETEKLRERLDKLLGFLRGLENDG